MIGFLETNYSANEPSELATVMFGLISGGVQSNVNVQLGFAEGTAQGKNNKILIFNIHVSITDYYICLVQVELTLIVLEQSSHSMPPVKRCIPSMYRWWMITCMNLLRTLPLG